MQKDRVWLLVPVIAIVSLALYSADEEGDESGLLESESILTEAEPMPGPVDDLPPQTSNTPREVVESETQETVGTELDSPPLTQVPETRTEANPLLVEEETDPCEGDAILGAIYFERNLNLQDSDRRVRDIQTFLSNEGLYRDGLDGVLGPATRHAILRYQEQEGQCASGFIDAWVIRVTTQ